ncbi:hypothetical protein [Pseudomonas sp. 22 E 5]|jgi:hypothetical protein|nr:hypothetical protein [Pseudomonas sp. 22 E 5]
MFPQSEETITAVPRAPCVVGALTYAFLKLCRNHP